MIFIVDGRKLRFGKIASIQTVAGTGANRLGAVFLKKHFPATTLESGPGNDVKAYLGTPTWGNYKPLLIHAGFQVEAYKYYDRQKCSVAFESVLDAARTAPEQSVFILQGCCHNPTGADMTQKQWSLLADEMQKRGHFAFFDVAYQGFGAEVTEDVWSVRHFREKGIPMLVCQSFSKNLGMYSERAGVLHVVCRDPAIAERVLDTLRSLARWEFSSAPSYGAHLASIVMTDPILYHDWIIELGAARSRLRGYRARLHHLLTEEYRTPGDWNNILTERGLFSFLKLNSAQINALIKEFHVYLPETGRINVAGLNDNNIESVARALNAVVRQT